MDKVKIDNIFCLNGDMWNFLQKRLLNSPQCLISLLFKLLYLTGCQATKRFNVLREKNMLKYLLLRNHKVDDTLHTCL